MSRADMARALGQTRATIGHAVTELVQAGLVVEAPEAEAEARIGRPSIAVSLNPQATYFVGIDVGTRIITCVLVDLRLGVVAEVVEPTGERFREPDHVLERLFEGKRTLLAKAGVPEAKIAGVAVSVPGLVARDGTVVNAPFLEWRDVPLRQHLIERCPRSWTVEVCNDAFAFASAECAVMDDPGRETMLMVLLAEGIGSAIVDNGTLVTGARGYSGELGHMVIGSQGRTDTFELLAGAKALASLIALDRRVDEGVAEILHDRGTDEVRQALDRWSHALAMGLANAIHLLDPGQIVLGGPLAALFPEVEAQVSAALSSMMLEGVTAPPIRLASFGANGAAIGAAAMIREAIFALPDLEEATGIVA